MSEGQCVSVTVCVCVSACVYAREYDSQPLRWIREKMSAASILTFHFIVVLPVLKAIKETVSLQKGGKDARLFETCPSAVHRRGGG